MGRRWERRPLHEFFSRGVELGNQVYIQYEHTGNGLKQLKLNVLDMGMGQERNAWFSQGSPTQYDATFPETLNYVFKQTGYKPDKDLMKKFTPTQPFLIQTRFRTLTRYGKTFQNS